MQQRGGTRAINRPISAEVALSVALSVLLGTGITPIPFAPLAGLLGVAMLPFLLPVVRRFHGMLTTICLLGLAVVAGVLLTALNANTHDFSSQALVPRVMIVVAFIGGVAILLYARVHIGSAGAAIAYGVGLVGAIALDPISSSNPWRFTFSLPVSILVLAILSLRNRLMPQLIALIALAVVGLLNDSRSNSAMLFLAAAILIWQRMARSVSRGRRRAGHLVGLILVVVGFLQLAQFSLLEGYFGEASQAKTEAQIAASGNLFLGGRPEAAASFALIRLYPFGLGGGLMPTGGDIYAAKSGMSAIGYDPNNGYVNRFMFGSGVEVHSTLGDFWIWYGLAGAAACVALTVIVIRGLDDRLRSATLTALLAYLSVRFFWDMFFSPVASSMTLMTLTIPLAAVAVAAVGDRTAKPTAAFVSRMPSSPSAR